MYKGYCYINFSNAKRLYLSDIQTQDHISVIRKLLEEVCDRKKDLFLVLLDMRVAFDTVLLATIINRSGKIDEENVNRIDKWNLIYYQIRNSIVDHRYVGKGTKLHIHKALYLPTLKYAGESCVMLDKQINRITGAEI